MSRSEYQKARRAERQQREEAEATAERERLHDRRAVQFIGTRRADGLMFLTCVKCGCMVDPDYADDHLRRCE